MTQVDARGLACPEPLMMAQAAVKKADGPVEVLVDSAVARDNIAKFAKKKKLQITITEEGGDYHLVIEP